MSRHCNCGCGGHHDCCSHIPKLCDTGCRTIPELTEYVGPLSAFDRVAIYVDGTEEQPANTYAVQL